MNAHQVTREFEAALCAYAGAPYAVAVNSCSMALLLACAWHLKWAHAAARSFTDGRVGDEWRRIEIPKRTYVSVPMSIIHAGGRPTFRDENWRGAYQLKPFPIWDSARKFTSGMYPDFGSPGLMSRTGSDELVYVPASGQMVCVSFHASKILGDTQGGAILHDDPEADKWLRRARFDGRAEGVAPKDDQFFMLGWHCYLSPDVATRLLWKLSVLPKRNDPLPNDPYPDLSTMRIFK